MSELKVDKITPRLGTTLTLGDSGDTINFGSGVLPNFENLTVTGDLTVDTNSLKVDSTNNFVGIGTATPAVALDVVGAITATGNITGTLATAAQPNITSVGTLTSATISGDLTVDTNTLYVDSTNNRVGIGTTSPSRKLHIQDNNSVNFLLENNSDGTVGSNIDLYHNSASPSTADFLSIINTSGNNSVGTKTDFAAIEAWATDYTAGSEDAALRIRGMVGGSLSRLLFYSSGELSINDDGADIDFRVESDTNTHALFVQGSDGNVGIGTASPSDKLNVYDGGINVDTTGGILTGTRYQAGSGSANINLYKSRTNTIGDHSALVNEDNIGGIITRASDGTSFIPTTAILSKVTGSVSTNSVPSALIFSTNSGSSTYTERMRIDSSGKVGIGTSTPYYQIDNRFDDSTTTLSGGSSGDWGGNGIRIENNNTTVGTMSLVHFRTGSADWHIGNKFVAANDSDFIFFHEASEVMRIDSSGNVGIGTTSPSKKLDVDGQVQFQNSSSGRYFNFINDSLNSYLDTSHSTIFRTNGATSLGEVMRLGTSDVVINEGSADVDFRVESNNKTHMLFVDGGNNEVGVATSSPEGVFDAYGTGYFGFQDYSTQATQKVLVLRGEPVSGVYAQSRFNFYTQPGTTDNGVAKLHIKSQYGSDAESSELFTFTSNGKLGLGTTAPSEKLSVVAEDDSSTIDNGFSIYRSVGDDKVTINAQGGAGKFVIDGGSTYMPTIFYNYNGTTLLENFRYDSGTTSMVFNEQSLDQDFRVESSGNTHMLFVDAGSNEVGIGTSDPRTALHIYGANNDLDGQLKVQSYSGDAGIVLQHPLNGRGMYLDNSDNNKFKIYGGGGKGIHEFTIDNTGNVGILKTSPTEALDVNGTVKATAFQGDGSGLTGISGGKVLQVVSATKTDTATTSSTTYGDITGLSVSITPSSASSKIYVVFSVSAGNSNGSANYRLVRNTTALAIGDAAGSRTQSTISSQAGTTNRMEGLGSNYLDSPSTTSATTYKVQWRVQNAGTNIYLNRSSSDADNESHPRGSSTITVMEIGA